MARGMNVWHGCGTVCSDVVYNDTRNGDKACGFRIAIHNPHKASLYIRVNSYGSHAEVCRKCELEKGDFVVIDGELMTRQGRDELLTEVRCRDLVIRKKNWNSITDKDVREEESDD